MKRLAVLTSGGDAPGMNAAIRAVVRTASYKEIDICGVIRGYRGLISGDFRPMNARSVDNITQRGGTILYSARSPEFLEPEGRAQAAENLRAENIDALVVIGTHGSVIAIGQVARNLPGLRVLNNLHPSEALDESAFDHVIRAPAAEAFPRIVEHLQEWRASL